ncbi:transmembrane protein [Mycobacterium tuberculosis CAS/NITR204]|uniref:Transmembrane protein n=1 Tax=Mycobacterium tuberculosis CAS/NITR204 TaxID=1310114 RepID=R4MML7_MYCTX|nr:transmembrane protein [Mycobacterium tuberculosis CAS/NITR204]
MHEVGGPSRGDRLGRDDSEVHSAIRFAVVAAVVGVGFLIMGALLVSTCSGVDTAACGPPQRILLALGGPLIPVCGRAVGVSAHLPGMACGRYLVGMARRRLVFVDADGADALHRRPTDRRPGHGTVSRRPGRPRSTNKWVRSLHNPFDEFYR